MVFLLKKEFALCFGGWVLGLIKFLSPVCLITFPYDRYSFPSNPFRFHGNDGLFTVVEESYGGFPFFVELDLRYPKQCAPVVFSIRQRFPAVIGAVEILTDSIALQAVSAVATCREVLAVGVKAVVDDDFRLVALFVFLAALFPGYVIGIDIEFVQPTQ